jgi:carbamoyl-phosphate synthase large subunit
VRALREEGYCVILVNSNPATIMTEPDLADATYIEPITPEWVERVIEKTRSYFAGGTGLGRILNLIPDNSSILPT